MVDFNFWIESFILWIIFGILIIVPCVLVALIGRKMIEQLGMFPSQTPAIHMSVVYKLVIIEVITFTLLMIFYQFFRSR